MHASMTHIALLTQHGKATAMHGLASSRGCELIVATGFDTDTLGTFTNERARQGTQIDAALTKARLACEMAGTRYGLGSEGSFGPDPFMGAVPWGIEVVVWHDAKRDRHVHAAAQGPQTNFRQLSAGRLEDALTFAERIGFPEHGLIVGRAGESWFDKEVRNKDVLHQRLRTALATGEVWLETDMRAHRNPTRMRMIQRAADALAQRLATPCPACCECGFGPVRLLPGARCQACGNATSLARAQVLECHACGHSEEQVVRSSVSPGQCDRCNR
jgi:hypothetical protein